MPENIKSNNRILSALSKKGFQRLLPDLKKIDLIYGEQIYETGEKISNIYFPESGIISLLSSVEEQTTLEVGVVGNEGMIGLPIFLGVEKSNNRAIVQGKGEAWKMSAKSFLKECKINRELLEPLHLYTSSLITQISQSAVCNRFHLIEPRLARWLMMTSDRMESDEFQITQEFLSNMLGVRREAVNKAASTFQKQNLIIYSRGDLKILNRAELEKTACQCYQIIKADTHK